MGWMRVRGVLDERWRGCWIDIRGVGLGVVGVGLWVEGVG